MAKFSGNSGGSVYKWTEKNQSLTGKFVSAKDGKYGPLFDFECDDGEVITCATSTGLLACFEEAFGGIKHVPRGTPMTITFKEMVKTKSGGDFKRFELEVPDDMLPNDDSGF